MREFSLTFRGKILPIFLEQDREDIHRRGKNSEKTFVEGANSAEQGLAKISIATDLANVTIDRSRVVVAFNRLRRSKK